MNKWINQFKFFVDFMYCKSYLPVLLIFHVSPTCKKYESWCQQLMATCITALLKFTVNNFVLNFAFSGEMHVLLFAAS